MIRKRLAPVSGWMGVFLILLPVAAGLWGCGSRQAITEVARRTDIKTVLVIPFKNQSALLGANEVYRCPLCGNMFTTGPVEAGAQLLATKTLIRVLGDEKSVALIQGEDPDSGKLWTEENSAHAGSEAARLARIGRQRGADAVLTGSVYRWVERSGSEYAAGSPASVGVHLDLIDAKTGEVIWHDRFDETQQYLINNLLKIGTFLKRKGKWVSAEELAAEGFRKVLKRSPIP